MGKEEEEEEAGRWAVERAKERVEKGDMEGALWLLQRAHPAARGLAEVQAVAQVCLNAAASSWNPCCSCASTSSPPQAPALSSSPHWYRILMVNEKANLGAIKKRFRQLALLLHPDKNKHSRAEEAFKLVSEAYAHLSDNKKRETFDSLIRQRECRKCSCESQPTWDPTTRHSRESLKGKNPNGSQSHYFPFDFHTAEWRMEHEKLRMFRERAQAKVDSLAHILKERRSRWNAEMGSSTKGRHGNASDHGMYRSNYQSNLRNQSKNHAERRAFYSRSLEELYQCKGATNDESSTGQQKISQILRGGGDALFVELQHLGRRSTSRYRQTPQVLQKLNGLLGILKEEMSGGNEDDLKSQDEIFFGEGRVVEGATFQSRASGAECSSPQKRGNKLEEELTVIDDFLAGLNERVDVENQPQQLRAHFTGWNNKRSTEAALNKNLKRNDGASSSYPESNRSGTTQSATICNAGASPAATGQEKEKIAQRPLRDHNLTSPSSRAMRQSMDCSGHWNKSGRHCSEEEKLVHKQKKKSEQLLRTLERLREETQSVVATLESMKSATEPRIFPAASCTHVPAPIAT